jgi:threonine/homoserine/homoserine lactone efflux protein
MYEMIEMVGMAFAIGITGALAPGPTLVATVNSSLKSGWTAGPKIALGHALVETLIFLLIAGGLALTAQQYSHYIAWIGGLALIAFGILTVKESKRASMTLQEGQIIGNSYIAGVITSAANPYFWIWWLSIGSAMVIKSLETGLIMAGLFMIGHWGADFGWYTLVSTSLDSGRSFISEAYYRRILAICGGFLICFGFYYLGSA